MTTTTILIDLMLAALMVATIVYAVILNRRLSAFRQGKEELRALIADFTVATEKARAGLDQLRDVSDESAKALDGVIAEAKSLREDIGFLIDRGAAVADRLAYDGRSTRQAPPVRPAAEDPVASLRKILQATR